MSRLSKPILLWRHPPPRDVLGRWGLLAGEEPIRLPDSEEAILALSWHEMTAMAATYAAELSVNRLPSEASTL